MSRSHRTHQALDLVARRHSPARRALAGLASAAVVLGTIGGPLVAAADTAAAAPPTSNGTTVTVDPPSVASITDGTSLAPWNTSQGDPATTAYPIRRSSADVRPGRPVNRIRQRCGAQYRRLSGQHERNCW